MSSANVVAVSTYKFDFGDYSGLVFNGGIFYPCWGDNSNSTHDNPEGTQTTLDAYTAAVIVPPELAVVRTATNTVLVSWPAPSSDFVLQESPLLTPPVWTNSAAATASVGSRKQAVIPLESGMRVYRLFHT